MKALNRQQNHSVDLAGCGITGRVIPSDIRFSLGLGLKIILLNYFLRKTSLLIRIGEVRDMKGEIFC
jgi:hypothetical protein